MQQEFEPKLPRDILKLSKNKSFYFRARFGAICSASKTKKYLLKNSAIGNRTPDVFPVVASAGETRNQSRKNRMLSQDNEFDDINFHTFALKEFASREMFA